MLDEEEWCLVEYVGTLPRAAASMYYVSHGRYYPGNKPYVVWQPIARGTRAQMELYWELLQGVDDDEES